jgi:predicted amidophosphoribosyltransferase
MSFMAEVRYAVASAADLALDLAMPGTCVGCYREGTTLCRDCRVALSTRLRGDSNGRTALPTGPPAPLLQLEWCAPFAGITRRALTRLSDAGEHRLSSPLGEAIAKRWATAGVGGDVIVPVPASPSSIHARGYDEAVLLARVAGRRLGLPVIEALERKPTALPATGRTFDVIGAGRIEGRAVVLVDAVVTTGATLAACATALIRARARVVSAVTVARDQYAEAAQIALAAASG